MYCSYRICHKYVSELSYSGPASYIMLSCHHIWQIIKSILVYMYVFDNIKTIFFVFYFFGQISFNFYLALHIINKKSMDIGQNTVL